MWADGRRHYVEMKLLFGSKFTQLSYNNYESTDQDAQTVQPECSGKGQGERLWNDYSKAQGHIDKVMT